MKHKKLRVVIITLVVLAAIVACYMGYFMRPQPLTDCLPGTQPPAPGQVTRYTEDVLEGETLELTDQAQVDALWQAIQDSQIRFLRGRGTVSAPQGGAYYEISLTSQDGSDTYAFGYSTTGELIIQGSSYAMVGEDPVGPLLAEQTAALAE